MTEDDLHKWINERLSRVFDNYMSKLISIKGQVYMDVSEDFVEVILPEKPLLPAKIYEKDWPK